MKAIYLKLTLALILTFLVGTTVGSLGTLHAVRSIARQWAHPDTREAKILACLDSRLRLNAQQHQEIAQALQEMKPKCVLAQQQAHKDRQALLDEFQAKIAPFLTDDQNQKLAQLRKKGTDRVHKFLEITQT